MVLRWRDETARGKRKGPLGAGQGKREDYMWGGEDGGNWNCRVTECKYSRADSRQQC